MKNKVSRREDVADLRRRAEERARSSEQPDLGALSFPVEDLRESPGETRRILHELRVHQIELEMQNEELRRAGAELDAARARYFDLYDLAPVGYVTISKLGLILEANLTVTILLGADRGSLVRRPITSFILNEDQDIYYSRRKLLFESGEPQTCELRMVKKDGTAFWACLESAIPDSSTSSEHDAIDASPVCRVVLSDITRRKQAEEALKRAADVLSQRNEEVRQFAYIVSHDLRAPLVNVQGFVSELHLSLAELTRLVQPAVEQLGKPEGARADRIIRQDIPEALGYIDSSVTRMDHMIGSLLRLSHAAGHDSVPEGLDLRSMVSEILASLGTQIEARGATISVLPLPRVTADRTSMEQILSNILTNAVLYLDPTRLGRIEVAGNLAGTELLVRVRDNGRGISPEDREKVFAPFQRGGGAADSPGEGMGLAYVQALVRRQGGRIWFDSEPGIGTTFSVVLPVARPRRSVNAERGPR